MNVSPVSSIPGAPAAIGSSVQPSISPSAERISITFPALPVAMMRRFMRTIAMSNVGMSHVSTLLQNLSLRVDQLANAGAPELEKLIESAAAERKALRRSLALDEFVAVRHDNIEIDVCARIFNIVQVEHGNAADNAHAHGGDVRSDGLRSQ